MAYDESHIGNKLYSTDYCCPNCGSYETDYDGFCIHCGEKVVYYDDQVEDSESVPPTKKNNTKKGNKGYKSKLYKNQASGSFEAAAGKTITLLNISRNRFNNLLSQSKGRKARQNIPNKVLIGSIAGLIGLLVLVGLFSPSDSADKQNLAAANISNAGIIQEVDSQMDADSELVILSEEETVSNEALNGISNEMSDEALANSTDEDVLANVQATEISKENPESVQQTIDLSSEEEAANTPATTTSNELEQAAVRDTESAFTIREMNAAMYAQTQVNVRDMPSTAGNVIGLLSENQKIQVTGQCEETGWYRFSYQNGVGYASSDYIAGTAASRNIPAAAATTAAAAPAVAQEAAGSQPEPQVQQAAAENNRSLSSAPYIANSNPNSKPQKFHLSSCPSVNDMAEHNKVPMYSREEAINAGYVPCKRCNP